MYDGLEISYTPLIKQKWSLKLRLGDQGGPIIGHGCLCRFKIKQLSLWLEVPDITSIKNGYYQSRLIDQDGYTFCIMLDPSAKMKSPHKTFGNVWKWKIG